MSKRDHLLYLEEIVEAMQKIQNYTLRLNYNQFIAHSMALDAVLLNFTIIGEASKQVPASIRERYPEVPWKRMAGFRDIIVHEYFGIQLEIVWNIIRKDILKTKPLIEKVLADLR